MTADPKSELKDIARLYVSELKFSDGTIISLKPDSILVLTGPNNAGKSSSLREIRHYLQKGKLLGPVLASIKISVIGTSDQFLKVVLDSHIGAHADKRVRFGYDSYDPADIKDDWKKGFVGSLIASLFFWHLGAGERLAIAGPVQRENYLNEAPTQPLLWMDIDAAAELRVASIFRNTFGLGLVLNRMAGKELGLHVHPLSVSVETGANSPAKAQALASLPPLDRQGDGLRSFVGALLGLLVQPRGIILLDEPEAFLHPPHIRRLASVVAEETSNESQIFVATHSDEFVRAMLDVSGDRAIFARLTRVETENRVTVLSSDDIVHLWTDPLLRTSDVLSALFHDAAVICEGDSDARFYAALLLATRQREDRTPDVRFYHFGGKDRMASVATALRALNVPVVVLADIDLLDNKEKFFGVFEALGGDTAGVEKDVDLIIRVVGERKGQLTGKELSLELKRLSEQVGKSQIVAEKDRREILRLARVGSNWNRLKEDGYRGLVSAEAIAAFRRVQNAAGAIGLLINPEGELESFCRDASRARKADWLAHVLNRDLAGEEALEEARKFAGAIRNCIEQVTQTRAR